MCLYLAVNCRQVSGEVEVLKLESECQRQKRRRASSSTSSSGTLDGLYERCCPHSLQCELHQMNMWTWALGDKQTRVHVEHRVGKCEKAINMSY